MRLHELVKELNADGKRMLELAKELNLGVKSHSSNLPKGTEGILRAAWTEELEELEAKAAKRRAREQKAAAEAAAAAEPAAAEPLAPSAEDGGTGAAPADAPVAPQAPEPLPLEAVAEVPAASAPEAPVAPSEPASDDPESTRRLVVTIGGMVALPGVTAPPADETGGEPGQAAAEGEGEAGDGAAEDETATTETTGPTRRRGARILGRIDLKPADLPARHRPNAAEPTEFDPLDPTRMAPTRRGARGPGRDTEGEAAARAKSGGKSGKQAFEWVFDPDDNSALAALRIGHVNTQRRGPMRRPPMRRNILGGRNRTRRTAARPTHGIEVRPPIGVRELSELLGVRTREILTHLTEHFDPRDKNAVLQADHLLELAIKMEREITVLEPETEFDRLLRHEDERAEALAGEELPRPPVVAVMGHVDHGKTSLLDALRKTRVAAGEAGGITQRTSAYSVRNANGATVTFLDTPGHKAFTEMRLRGAQLTDVALLVVAADDGPMEQTLEAIDHVTAAGVPLVVAINKIDKNNADPRMVRQKLASAGVMVEDYGGEVGVVECSATTGAGLEQLVERLALETEILELRADPKRPARGIVVDSRKDPKLGVVATIVVTDGTLRAKDALLAGTAVGRVRWLIDDRGERIAEAGPGVPVQVLGFEQPPEAGAEVFCVEDINQARLVVRERQEAARKEAEQPAAVDTVTLENLFETIESREVTEINVMVKADQHGTLDVLKRTIEELKHAEVRFKVVRAAVGGITEDDVLLASASKSILIGFAVTTDADARKALARTGVELKTYDVIYEMQEDLEKALEGELAPEKVETILGHAVIREIFKSSRLGNIAGCYVTDGVITRDARVRLSRDGKVVWTGKLDSLKRFKDDVKEVRENYECGLHLSGYDDIKAEDVLEAFEVNEVKRTLSSPALA